jgi:hypothetical protein
MSSKCHYGGSASFSASYPFTDEGDCSQRSKTLVTCWVHQVSRSRVFDNLDDACEILSQKMQIPCFARMKTWRTIITRTTIRFLSARCRLAVGCRWHHLQLATSSDLRRVQLASCRGAVHASRICLPSQPLPMHLLIAI